MESNLFYSGILVTLGLTLMLLALVWLAKRRQGKRTGVIKRTHLQFLLYLMRLVGFTLLTVLIVAGGVLVYVDYRSVQMETVPAPSRVEIPADLLFDVEEVVFDGGDELKMRGWFIPSRNGVTVILLHGYGGNRTAMRWHAEQLVAAGYGVLMYDERASGESDGDHRSYGWEDIPDVGGAIGYLGRRPDVDADRIAIGGCSMGAMIALHAAAGYPELKAVWADGAGGMRAQDLAPINSPGTALATVSNYVLEWMYLNIWHISPVPPTTELLGQIEPRPIMFVASGAPHPIFGSEAYYVEHLVKFAGEHAALWVIPDAGHCGGPGVRPDEYSQRMVVFFDDAFGIER